MTNQTRNLGRLLHCGVAAMALTMGVSAQAQQADTAKSPSAAPAATPATADIIVTAQRREESINRVGMAIQAISSDTLKTLHVTTVRDLGAVVPSFVVSQNYEGVPVYTLRGVGFNPINLSGTATVGTYTDEVAYAYPIMNSGPLIDVERVEVLKGPQGTLYGRNTTAGLIDFVTGKPSATTSGAMSIDVGSYGTTNVGGYVTGPVANGIQARLGYRVDLSNEGWQVSNTRGERLGKIKRYGLRGSVAMQPMANMKVDLSATYWINKSDTIAAQATGFEAPADPATGKFGAFNVPGLASYIANNQPTNGSQADWSSSTERGQDAGSVPGPGAGAGITDPLAENDWFLGLKARVEFDLSDSTRIISLTGFNQFVRRATSDWSGAPYEILVQQTDGHIKSFSQELRVEGSGSGYHWLVGGYYAKDTIYDGAITMFGDNDNVRAFRAFTEAAVSLPANAFLAAFGFPDAPNTFGYTLANAATAFREFRDYANISTNVASIFANADYAFNDMFKLTLGGRYTDDRENFAGCSADINGSMLPNVNLVMRGLLAADFGQTTLPAPIAANGCTTYHPDTNSFGVVYNKQDETNFAWRSALNVTLSPTALLYASISRGYKSGSIPVVGANIALQDNPVKQEELTAYEIGAKLGTADRRLHLDLSAFYYDYKNKQLGGFYPDPVFGVLAQLINIPKSEAYGIEGELTVHPVPGFTLIGNGLWLKTKILDFIGTNASGASQNFAGAIFSNSPEYTMSGTALYDRPINDRLDFTANANIRWQSKQTTDLAGDTDYDIKPYSIVNAGIGLKSKDGKWAFDIWAHNLFNTYYWTAVYPDSNVVVRFPGQVRTVGATGGIRF